MCEAHQTSLEITKLTVNIKIEYYNKSTSAHYTASLMLIIYLSIFTIQVKQTIAHTY